MQLETAGEARGNAGKCMSWLQQGFGEACRCIANVRVTWEQEKKTTIGHDAVALGPCRPLLRTKKEKPNRLVTRKEKQASWALAWASCLALFSLKLGLSFGPTQN